MRTLRPKVRAVDLGQPHEPVPALPLACSGKRGPFAECRTPDLGQTQVTVRDWHPISTAPSDRDLQLGVIENEEVHFLVFPCRRTEQGWVDASNGKSIRVDPTFWREW